MSETTKPAPPSAPAPVPAPKETSGPERLAQDLFVSVPDAVVEVIPESVRRNPVFRGGLYFRVFLALVLTGLLIWRAVSGLDWVEISGGAVTILTFWAVTIAKFRGVQVELPRV
jgi:hypothetical protein